ncbi:uncharacterized protein LOC129596690 [Paramacrobiotus metropolitanus]|uniref:uncharacterized protein LOC129596690 n=1 Tax=Paramacrobiotus metropolitanus TaxID=2943436 RepID=UPI0024461610|nr:uncharacterized protein LOC129596690 [Paramacrobiotus metropolitanus]
MHKICIKSWGQSQSTPGLNRTNISDTVSEIGNFSSNPVLFTHPPVLQRRGNVGEVRVRGLNLDLNHGFLPGLEEPQDARKNRHLNILLNWLREHPDDFHNAAPEIICWSSTLKEVMLTAVHVKAPKGQMNSQDLLYVLQTRVLKKSSDDSRWHWVDHCGLQDRQSAVHGTRRLHISGTIP